jgi:hypothetical protein
MLANGKDKYGVQNEYFVYEIYPNMIYQDAYKHHDSTTVERKQVYKLHELAALFTEIQTYVLRYVVAVFAMQISKHALKRRGGELLQTRISSI